ncbi:MAG: MBL fold metallo-hydrolase, partial [Deltaproteobacteria bacterium]|nr:MBL fold metallo-hydrolase [Deltaproteobacteria bacterium]
MINYVIISGLSAMILVSLTIILFLIRFGFMKYNIKEWIQPEIDEPESWNQIFRKSKKLEIKPLYMGRSVTEPGARPYLRPESYPADFDFSASESAPTMSFIINHESQGDILIDAGINSSYTPENHSGDLPLVLKLYQKISKYHYENDLDENLASYIEKLDLKPEYLLITHLHPDHIAGLTEL